MDANKTMPVIDTKLFLHFGPWLENIEAASAADFVIVVWTPIQANRFPPYR